MIVKNLCPVFCHEPRPQSISKDEYGVQYRVKSSRAVAQIILSGH
jgi:hypothetical protein